MPQLDSLRAGAVMVVMLWHFTSRDTPARELAVVAGVRLFFVLSGFLITSLLLNARDRYRAGTMTFRAAARTFFLRRALRIMPIYYGTLIVAAAFQVKAVTDSFWWLAAYLGDIRIAATNSASSVSHFWSLAVEEQFYLVWPWIVLLTSTRQLRRVCVAAIVAAPLFRLLMVAAGYSRFGDLLMFGQLDSLGAGALIAIFRHERRLELAARWSLYGSAATFAIVAALVLSGLALRPSVRAFNPTAITWLLLVPMVAHGALGLRGFAGRVLELRPARYVGRISYGVYLYHPFMSALVPALGRAVGLSVPRMGVASVLMLIAASLTSGAISWHVIERPIGAFRSRLTGQSGVVTSRVA